MEKKNATEPLIEKHSFGGHAVEIRNQEGREELWIDGVRRKFFVTDDGYTLHEAAYERPQKSLLEAVKQYLRKYSAQSE